MAPKTNPKAPKVDFVEDGPEEGAAGGQPMVLHSREEPMGPTDMDAITNMLQQCLQVGERNSETGQEVAPDADPNE